MRVRHQREEVDPEPGHTQGEAEDNTSDSVFIYWFSILRIY